MDEAKRDKLFADLCVQLGRPETGKLTAKDSQAMTVNDYRALCGLPPLVNEVPK